MEEEFKKGKGKCPQLLDLITNHGDWRGKEKRVEKDGVEVEEGEEEEEEEEELELRLGPPGKEEHRVAERKEKGEEPSLLSLSKVAKSSDGSIPPCFGSKRGFLEGFQQQHQQQQQQQKQSHERKGSGLPTAHAAASGKAAGANNSSQTRTAAAPVVGWPPIRSFRKNLASTSKPCVEPQNRSSENESEKKKKGLFVKINMDGIPIGRKVDLKAYDSFEKLSWAVDELFRGLLAAQRDPLATGTAEVKEKQVITGLLDGSGEYTLVYEDEEGDRMLIGDVPWNMFVSTAKRLRVMRTSDLSASFLRKVSRKRAANEC